MLDLRPVLYTLGGLICMMSAGMILPIFMDLLAGNPDWEIFILALFLSLTIGGMLMLGNRGTGDTLNLKQAFLLTTSAW
ncbi:MAG: potassium transporter TrkH, partial [Kordiimonas sp.]